MKPLYKKLFLWLIVIFVLGGIISHVAGVKNDDTETMKEVKKVLILLGDISNFIGIGIFLSWLRKKSIILRRVIDWGILPLTVILILYLGINTMSAPRRMSTKAAMNHSARSAWVLDSWLAASLKTGKDSKKTEIDTDENEIVEAGKDMTNAELSKAGVCSVWIELQNRKMKNPFAGWKLPEGTPLWSGEDKPGQISCIQQGDKIIINAFNYSGIGKDNTIFTRTIVPEPAAPEGKPAK